MDQIRFKFSETLDEIGTTRNKVAVISRTRPATVLDLASGETKTIKLETLVHILNAVNEIAREKGIHKTYGINDIIEYMPKKPHP